MIDKFKEITCNGCQMCKEICPKHAIRYEINKAGFWFPKVDYAKCIECGLCVKKCPNKTKFAIAKSAPSVKAIWSKDKDVRLASTSGGLFYELAKSTLESDGYVEGCVYDDDYKGAHQVIIHSMKDIKPLMVSKYVESDAEGIYPKTRDALLTGKPVLFVGAPCQCAALYNYLGKDYDNLIVVDFLCRGANSPKAHRSYITYLEKKYQSRITNLRSKDKRNGWERFGQSALFENGEEYFLPHEEDLRVVAYHKGNLMVRESCLDCKFKSLPRYSDITLGDFWGIKPHEVEDIDSGVSLCFINSDKGEKIIDDIKERIQSIDKSLEEAKAGNPAIYSSASCSKNRIRFLSELDTTSFDVLVKKYADKEPTLARKGINKIITIVKKVIRYGNKNNFKSFKRL